jgi:hypothetical protein
MTFESQDISLLGELSILLKVYTLNLEPWTLHLQKPLAWTPYFDMDSSRARKGAHHYSNGWTGRRPDERDGRAGFAG